MSISNEGVFASDKVRTKILGTGSAVPKKVLTNEDVSKMVDTTDEWIVTRTGIRERRVVSEGETASSLACGAARAALADADIEAESLDMIIVATMSCEKRLPPTSFLVQDKLGAKNAFVYDVAVACSGFLYGLSIANQYVRSGSVKKALVIGVEIMSRVVNWKDRNTCVLFGDAAGAAIVGPTDQTQRTVISTDLYSDGSLYYLLEIPGGGTAVDWTAEMIERGDHFVKMRGQEVFREAVESMTRASETILQKAGLSVDDIDLFIPHQANIRIVQAIARRLHCPMEKVFINLDKYGNTSSASIPLALDEAIKAGRVKAGDKILLSTFGAGFAWGSALIQW